ncbi:unnamed protein product [Rhodiola kirilowii]
MSATSVAPNLNNVPILNGINFDERKQNIRIFLGIMDLDLALRQPKPVHLSNSRSAFDRKHLRTWERSNRLSLMIIRRGILETFRAIVPDEISSAKDYLTELKKHFFQNEKVKTSELLANLISMKYSAKGNVREHIMEMSQLASKLKA